MHVEPAENPIHATRFRRGACAFAFVAVLLIVTTRVRAEYIHDFSSTIKVQKDASIDVTETIVMDFENTPRHGIYRFIPIQYERYGGTYSLEFRMNSVTDESGKTVKYSEKRQGHDVNIRMGDPDKTVTGQHTYKLHYIVRRALNFFDGEPELYWNVCGPQWPYPIRHASATVIPPDGVKKAEIKTISFVGGYGSKVPADLSWDGDNATFSTPKALTPPEELTIAVRFPKESVIKPSLMQELWWFAKDWWPLFILPLLAAAYVYNRWMAIGRDEDAGRQAVGVEWEPPKDLTPAEVGTLIDESCDVPDIIATLVDLASRGYLTIRELKTSKLLFLSTSDYEFTRIVPPPVNDRLLEYERLFLEGVFGYRNGTVMLSSLRTKFYVNIEPIKKQIYEALTTRSLFKRNPATVRGQWITGGVIVGLLGVGWLWLSGGNSLAFPIGLILSGIIIAFSSRIMPAKTAAGTRKLLECLSFQRFVSLVERDRIAMMAKSDPTIFGRLLPYAMVLGVADQWAEAFKDLMVAAPDWYSSNGGNAFDSYYFVHSLGHGMRTMQQTMTSRPQSSAGSGGSGFSGGGSGGGFGGGGGGSW